MEIKCIETNLLTQGHLNVTIVKVESPLLFCVQLKNSAKNLKELEEELEFRMSRKATYLHIWPEDFKENMTVAIKDCKSWQRGLIKKINRTNWMIKICLGDWGRSTWRRMSEVYLLEDRFKELL